MSFSYYSKLIDYVELPSSPLPSLKVPLAPWRGVRGEAEVGGGSFLLNENFLAVDDVYTTLQLVHALTGDIVNLCVFNF